MGVVSWMTRASSSSRAVQGWVMGTTGTITGTSRFLKEKSQDIRVIGAQPAEGSRIPGIRKWPEAYMIIRATQKKMMSKPVTSTEVGR